MAKAGKNSKNTVPVDNPVWKILNNPDFVKRCAKRDNSLALEMHALTALPREVLGEFTREALHRTTDQRAGKFIRALADAMTERAIGDIAYAVFEQCEYPTAST